MLFSKEENKNLHQIKSEEKRKIRNEIFEGKFTYGLQRGGGKRRKKSKGKIHKIYFNILRKHMLG